MNTIVKHAWMSYDALVGSSLLGVHTTQLGVQTTQHFKGSSGAPRPGWVWCPVASNVAGCVCCRC